MAYQQSYPGYPHYQGGSHSNGQSHRIPVLYPHVVIPVQPRGVADDYQTLPLDTRPSIQPQSAIPNGRQANNVSPQYPGAPHPDISPSVQAHGLRTSPQQVIRNTIQNPDYPIDYQLLLLSLADEYLAVAHGQGPTTALSQHDQDFNDYCKLVATALGCMEALLKKWRLQPIVEAKLRLKYARVLYEETENLLEAETVLTKGIDLCERNRFVDLKYAMQALLVWILSRSNRKAALKAADGMIEDVQAYRQTAWEYAFRFLCAGLATSGSSQQDLSIAVLHLQKISSLAESNGDKAVLLTGAVLEGFAHLQSANLESVSLAQRALAKARQLQLDAEVQGIAQLQIMTLLLDLACYLFTMNTDQATRKMQALQSLYDDTISTSAWRSDGMMMLLLSSRSLNGVTLHGQDGIIRVEDGKPYLCLSWLTRGEVYVLSNLFNASAISHKNPTDGHKAERFLLESVRSLRNQNGPQGIQSASVAAIKKAISQRGLLEVHCLIQLAFLQASRGDWGSARRHYRDAVILQQDQPDSPASTVNSLLTYLDGIIAQGTGDLDRALGVYQRPSLSLNRTFPRTVTSTISRDLSILSACNTIIIIYPPTHPSHHLLNNLLPQLLPYHQPQSTTQQQNPSSANFSCTGIPRLLTSALSLTSSLLPTTTPSTLKTKQHLSLALNTAREISHNQIQCTTLALMSNRFFKGVVGEQADKAGRAGKAMAGKTGNPLWLSVADGVVAEGMEMRGRKEEAEMAWREAQRYAETLPEGVKSGK